MARTVEELKREVRLLASDERKKFLRDLIADLYGEEDQDAELAWLEEARCRYGELQNGVTKPVRGTDVISRAKARLKHEG